jgi:hypothetical protein
MAHPDARCVDCVCIACKETQSAMQKLEEEACALLAEKEMLQLEVTEKTAYILSLQKKLDAISRMAKNSDSRSIT